MRRVCDLRILPVVIYTNEILVEFATVGKTKAGKVYHHLWGAEEIDALLKQHGLAKPDEGDGDDRMET